MIGTNLRLLSGGESIRLEDSFGSTTDGHMLSVTVSYQPAADIEVAKVRTAAIAASLCVMLADCNRPEE